MAMFRLPANLVEGVRADVSSERRNWVAALPDVVGELVARWSLELGEPYQPGGQSAWVAPARDPAGRDLVLKVGWRHDEAADEADGLRAWAGRGAVLVRDSYAWVSTSALLLEPSATVNSGVKMNANDVDIVMWPTITSHHGVDGVRKENPTNTASTTSEAGITSGRGPTRS